GNPSHRIYIQRNPAGNGWNVIPFSRGLGGGKAPPPMDVNPATYHLMGQDKVVMRDVFEYMDLPDDYAWKLTPDELLARMKKTDTDMAKFREVSENLNSKITEDANNYQSILVNGIDINKNTYRKNVDWGGVDKNSDRDILYHLFKDSKGISIGEIHTENAVNDFVKNNMSILKANGVKAIFVEGIFGQVYQADLDRYFATGIITPSLDQMLRQTKRYEMAVEARKNGIKIIGIESPSITRAYAVISARNTRLRNFNYFASGIINDYQKTQASGKWVMISGNRHAANTGTEIGIAERMQATSLVVYDNKGDRVVNFDAWYKRNGDIRMTYPNAVIGI
ncbi:membrane-targeted effector domain-containing toxin, partial [Brucella anthropi]|uniref:membrane-targeted effector domain-containing toxin n=1 Tax=Brucella anthropi TaxID=529 RepID=UPI00384E1C10